MRYYRDVIADAIGDFEGHEPDRDKRCADKVLEALHSAGYTIIKDRTDPEGGIPGRG